MKLINYRCIVCYEELEKFFQSTETPPKFIKHCPRCGNKMVQFNLKNNSQVWKFNDKK